VLAPHVARAIAGLSVVLAGGERFRSDNDVVALRMPGQWLRIECERTATSCVYLGARVLPEGEFNHSVEADAE